MKPSSLRSLLYAGAVLSWAAPAARPQSATFQTEARLVEVYAAVFDHKGRYVDDLTRERFRLVEDGSAQPIVAFENHSTAFSCVLLLDTTGSMSHALPVMKNAALKLLDEMRPADSVAVYGFSDSLAALQEFTQDKEAAKRAVLRTRPRGRTALFDAIAEVAREVGQRGGKKAIVVFTDGDDNASVLNLEAAMNRARKIGVPVYAIAQGEALLSPRLVGQLRRVAELTGGSSYEAHKAGDIEKIFADISSSLQHTYLLAYKPPRAGDHRWRNIEVVVSGLKEYRIRAKQGYMAE